MKNELKREEVTEMLDEFKQHLLTRMLEIENQLKVNLSSMKNENENKLKDYNNRMDRFNTRIDEIENIMNKNKVKLENVDDLLIFQQETAEKLITQGVKINGVQKDIKDAINKYDKIYLDNLFIPGLIGEFCRFKNNREFVEYNLNNLQSLINFKDKCIGDLKASNIKVDTMTKSITGQIESLEKGVKSYAQVLVETSQTNLKSEIDSLIQKIQENKMENHRYAVDLKNAASELKTEKELLSNIKNEIYSQLDSTSNSFKEMHKGTNENFDKIRDEYELIKKKFTEIAEFVKDVRFKKNLGVEVSKKDLKKISNAITYDPKYNTNQFASTERVNKKKEIESEIKKKEYSPEKDLDNSDEHSVNINEKDEVESYVKKYISGVTSMTNSKCDNKKISKSPFMNTNKIITETVEENDLISGKTNLPIEENTKMNFFNVANMNNTISGVSDIHSIETNKMKKNKIVTKIEVEVEKKEIKEIFNNTDLIDSNLLNNDKKATTFIKKKGFKERFPHSRAILTEREKLENTVANKSVERNSKNNNGISNINNSSQGLPLVINNNTSNLKKETQNLQIYHDQFSNLKKEIFKRFNNSEKRLNDVENTFKYSFDQLVSQIKNFLPLTFSFNQSSPKPKMNSNENISENNTINYGLQIHNNPYLESQNIVNNNMFSVNILDPTILFKSNDNDTSNKNQQKKVAQNLGNVRNNTKKLNDNLTKEYLQNPAKDDVVITKIRAKSTKAKKE